MKKMHKIFKIIGICLGVAGVLTLLGFVSSMRSAAPCEAVEVHFDGAEPLGLVIESEIRSIILENHGPVLGNLLGEIDTRVLEETVLTLPHIKDADVYKTIDKRILIDVEERKPIARLIDRKGIHAMVDADGFIMPLSGNAVPRLPVVSGSFTLNTGFEHTVYHISDTLADRRLQGIFDYCVAVCKDDFWEAQLQHTEVQSGGELVVHPQVGNHVIAFGKPVEISEKLDKLRILYEHGMGEANWNKYALINLKYKDQIVCTKK